MRHASAITEPHHPIDTRTVAPRSPHGVALAQRLIAFAHAAATAHAELDRTRHPLPADPHDLRLDALLRSHP